MHLLTNISTESLGNGLHIFNTRFKDEHGQWSSCISQHFLKLENVAGIPNTINGYRYWIDSDIHKLKTINIPAATNPRYILDQINLANLDTGTHVLYMQFKDLQNMWSCAIADTFYNLGQPRLNKIVSASGGNTGDVTVNIYGTGFYSGSNVKLTRAGQPDIMVPDSMTSIYKGQRLQITLDLREKQTGLWNVVVTVPGDTVMTMPNGFTIEVGKAPEPYAEIIGFDAIRIGQWQSYSIAYGNRGNVDAAGVPLWLAVPQNAEIIINDSAFIYIPKSDLISFDTIPLFVLLDSINGEPFKSKVYGFIISCIPAGSTGVLNFKMKVNSGGSYQLMAWTDLPYYHSPFNPGVGACIDDITKIIIGAIPGVGCIYNALRTVVDVPIKYVIRANSDDPKYSHGNIWGSFAWDLAYTAISCAPLVSPFLILSTTFTTSLNMAKVARTGLGVNSIIQSCSPIFQQEFGTKKTVNVFTSYDPNAKAGPMGSGSNNYITNGNSLSYIIHFENMDTSSASAQTVRIIDTLNTALFDLSTLELGFVSIGDTMLFPSPGSKSHSMMIDLRPKNDLVVEVTGGLNESTGVLTWTFTSLDPITLLPTENPFAGFLPPNKTAPEGEGSVFYSVRLKDPVPNNSIIENKAYIFFDFNESIPTNNWSNTIDNIKPHSKVDLLPSFINDSVFTVTWSGSDTSSGIKSYSVYVSENSGNYYPLVINTLEKHAVFSGHIDSTYRFYSIAIDSAGNIESVPLIPDASTTIATPESVNNFSANGFDVKIYPNPTSSSATIEYWLAQPSDVNIAVYNPLGEAVSMLTKEKKAQGIYKTVFERNNLSPGIYYCKINVNGKMIVKKVIFVN